MVHDACLGTDTLVAFIEGDTPVDVRDRVTDHAANCETCRQMLSMLADRAKPRRIGRYELVRELGSGGMGVVYAAYDPELDRTVAIKLLDAVAQDRSRREAQAMAQLAHPNVVRVYDVGETEGHIYIAMELIDGETLGAWQRAAQHPAARILAHYREAGRGLAAAHAAGIVHRDFKPDNVLLGPAGAIVADFGLALDREKPDPHGTVAGTPLYMAPELYAGQPADVRSDQFAFA
ncbi:MAG TPA: serine/threonine-protein kinase, partial [Kofleriaceae bacterium]